MAEIRKSPKVDRGVWAFVGATYGCFGCLVVISLICCVALVVSTCMS